MNTRPKTRIVQLYTLETLGVLADISSYDNRNK